MSRIEICGGIAAGKTTLANILEKEGFRGVYERFQDNPFLNDFYNKEDKNNNFETEITFVLLHYNLIKTYIGDYDIVCDYSLLQDFCYGVSNLVPKEKNAFLNLYEYVTKTVTPPDLIIYLKCGMDCLLERIKARGREMELSITREYLQATVTAMENVITDRPDVLIIESDKFNFLGQDRDYIVEKIKNALRDKR